MHHSSSFIIFLFIIFITISNVSTCSIQAFSPPALLLTCHCDLWPFHVSTCPGFPSKYHHFNHFNTCISNRQQIIYPIISSGKDILILIALIQWRTNFGKPNSWRVAVFFLFAPVCCPAAEAEKLLTAETWLIRKSDRICTADKLLMWHGQCWLHLKCYPYYSNSK